MEGENREVVRELRQKVDEAKSSLSSNRSRGKVLDALMQQKKKGKIPGIFGRLVNNKHIVTFGNISIIWYLSSQCKAIKDIQFINKKS